MTDNQVALVIAIIGLAFVDLVMYIVINSPQFAVALSPAQGG